MFSGGRQLFHGETASHTMADVLRADIDWSRLLDSPAGDGDVSISDIEIDVS